jgi:hypothetical protein
MINAPPHDLRPRLQVVSIVIAVMFASLFFRILKWGELEHTSLVFIGVPAVMAVVVALLPRPESATGMVFKAITLGLLIAAVAFGEAFVCILFAAPLLYAVGGIIGLLVDWLHTRSKTRPWAWILLGLVITPASLEGVVAPLEFERFERVSVVGLVDGSAADVAAALAQSPRFDRPLPIFLRLGFPRPGKTTGAGLDVGDARHIEFLHGHHPGVLSMQVERSEPGLVIFAVSYDDSYITHWLSWRRAEVRWRAVSDHRTEVSWTLSYRRRLDPAWYFAPLERYGTQQAARYLLESLTNPLNGPGS